MLSEENMGAETCVSCGKALDGKFCSYCGEKQLKAEEKSVVHFFGEAIHLFTHADSKFLKSLKYLFTKPGFLTAEYLVGRRKLYTSPLTLFFIANLIYFLFSPVDALNSRYASQTQGQFYSKDIIKKTEAKMKARQWTPREMEKHYNSKSSTVSKLLLISFVFLLSIPLSILFYGKNVYYFDHLVFATEFVSFLIYIVLEAIPILLFGIALLWELTTGKFPDINLNSSASLWFLLGIMWLYVAVGAKRLYKQNWIIPKALLFALSTGFVVLLYRYILFHATLWML
jgi:hypothetical protein